MSDLTLQLLTRLKVNRRVAGGAIAAGARRIADRLRREQTGQDVLEYSGLIVLIAGVFAILFTLQVPQTICTAIAHALNATFQNNHTYNPPTAIPDPTKG